jgi:hypothetical protein
MGRHRCSRGIKAMAALCLPLLLALKARAEEVSLPAAWMARAGAALEGLEGRGSLDPQAFVTLRETVRT